jgi:hypothetical protein
MPRALWAKAPLALVRHPVGFLAALAASLLAAMGATAAPLLTARAESEALQNKLAQLTPLGAGLTIERQASVGGAAADRKRRRAAAALARSLPGVGAPVLTTTAYAQVAGSLFEPGNPLIVVPMARTGATAHVERLAGDGHGAWLSAPLAQIARAVPGGTVAVVRPSPAPPEPRVRLRVGAVYRQLDSDLGNPYWVNLTTRIRAPNPDAPPPPTFLLVDPATLYRIARVVGSNELANVYELPIDVRGMTPARAKDVAAAFASVRRSLASHDPLARRLGCDSGCNVSSSLLDATILARRSNAALRPIVSLLAAAWALAALAAAVVAGVFTTRRRAVEARLSLVGGEQRTLFAARSAVEALLPSAAGAVAGFGLAVVAVRSFTPRGAVDASVYRHAALLACASALGAVAAVATGATAARGELVARRAHRLLAHVPWELPVVGAAFAAWISLSSGRALVGNPPAGSHPRLAVFLLPALVAAAVAGAAGRAARALVRRRGGSVSAPVFLALRRLAAAGALAGLLAVAVAVGASTFAFAEVLRSSLAANTVEKAYVANGSDVQGVVDAARPLPASFPYPLTKVGQAFDAGVLPSGRPFELLLVDPHSLARVLAPHWPSDVGRAVAALAASHAAVPAIAVGARSGTQTVSIGGRAVRVDVIATLHAFPGMLGDRPLLVVPRRSVATAPGALAYVWATGPARAVVRALARSTLAPSYVTTVRQFSQSADVTTITRTYGFVRIFGIALMLLALVALPLYLAARLRSQTITSAFLRRLGMSQRAQALSVALEATAIVAFAMLAGVASGLAGAGRIVARVDPLPEYAPRSSVVVPWASILAAALAIVVVGAAAGAVATLVLRRRDVGEALRVA